MKPLLCRFCEHPLTHVFVDLGVSPLSNAFLSADAVGEPEVFYPLTVYVCDACLLVQLPAVQKPEDIFKDYAYFSSFSETWLDHARTFAGQMISRLSLDAESRVVEVASNDGYLLRFFKDRGIPVLGIEPAANVAGKAVAAGIRTTVEFFGQTTASRLVAEGESADLLIGNNVLAHVPDLNDFVSGLRKLLKPGGVLTMEFPHIEKLILESQFDTIYHEHFSYFSLTTAEKVFKAHSLTVFDVDELTTHGGSLRVYVQHGDSGDRPIEPSVAAVKARERKLGFASIEGYSQYAAKVHAVKRELLSFLIHARATGKRVVGYGAPAKANTLLNYCGIRTDLLDYTVDRSPHKQGLFLPGTRIPVYAPSVIAETRPDFLLILPWNLSGEISEQMKHIRQWGGKFVVPIPKLTVLE